MITQFKPILWFCAILLILIISCERNEGLNVGQFDCADCYQEKPDSLFLNARFTINTQNPWVALVVYKGNVEDGIIDYTDTTYQQDYWLLVKVDEYYSLKAKYLKGSDTIYAIDGSNLKLRKTESNCDEPCFYTTGESLDVRLKD
ncbi:MAG: hypothetical protein K9G76_07090 [Bacteroidales bacterium]|nr:hypothetical protein [Bacteroidales bacterium]MCF8404551.1 hypothetical protein [Bacteroidales bacterium]